MTPAQAVVIFGFCIMLSAAFGFGAAMGRRSITPNVLPAQQQMAPPLGWDGGAPFGPPRRGTFGAIDGIQGDVIQMRDPRSGRTWRVRAGEETVIEFGRQRRIPFENLRVGQRIFVVGAPGQFESADEFDAQFIGVVLGEQQRYVRPAREPVLCWECFD